ncbi:hypothetical protein B5G17_15240 [Bacteroides uniformis]|uniref:Uncharacterized protein n=1 Tax=Bacteroides uniformis TaxID=820 RepID=A0A1Y3V191_BACUN|nr:hypothetical protein B5G17_15240 [Bacteroides uniformis]
MILSSILNLVVQRVMLISRKMMMFFYPSSKFFTRSNKLIVIYFCHNHVNNKNGTDTQVIWFDTTFVLMQNCKKDFD